MQKSSIFLSLFLMFGSFASAETIDLSTLKVAKQSAFDSSAIQKTLDFLIRSYAVSGENRKTYERAFEKLGILKAELVAAEKSALRQQKSDFISSCVEALLGNQYDSAIYASLRDKNPELDQFTEKVMLRGLTSNISLDRSIDHTVSTILFGVNGVFQNMDKSAAEALNHVVLPENLVSGNSAVYDYKGYVEKAQGYVTNVNRVLKSTKIPKVSYLEKALAAKVFITVNSMTAGAEKTEIDLTLHSPCALPSRLVKSYEIGFAGNINSGLEESIRYRAQKLTEYAGEAWTPPGDMHKELTLSIIEKMAELNATCK